MIISRTPLRISFLGGGSDYPQWYNEHGGAILGTSINKYCYVMLHNGKSWATFDLPTKSGLGTSSAYTVGLLRVCTTLDKTTIAKLATIWEQDKLGGNIGSQDQYLCSLGGFRHLKFSEHGVRDSLLSADIVEPLQDYLMLFDTHQYRRAGDVVAHQLSEMGQHQELLAEMMASVEIGMDMLKKAQYRLLGGLLDRAWQLKRQLSKYVSTPAIDAIYDAALKVGAVGGKLLGAGGGGFILFVVEPEKQEAVKKALADLTYVPFKFEFQGTQVIYEDANS